MFLSINNLNSDTAILDIATDEINLTYILKFRLSLNVIQYIDFCLIFNDIYIDDFTTTSDIILNSWVFNCLESYQLSPSLVINIMLKVFCDKFYKSGYMKFSKLDQNIRQIFKKTLMVKGIYMD